MDAHIMLAESTPGFLLTEKPNVEEGFASSFEDPSDYGLMVRSLYFPPIPDCVWTE